MVGTTFCLEFGANRKLTLSSDVYLRRLMRHAAVFGDDSAMMEAIVTNSRAMRKASGARAATISLKPGPRVAGVIQQQRSRLGPKYCRPLEIYWTSGSILSL